MIKFSTFFSASYNVLIYLFSGIFCLMALQLEMTDFVDFYLERSYSILIDSLFYCFTSICFCCGRAPIVLTYSFMAIGGRGVGFAS